MTLILLSFGAISLGFGFIGADPTVATAIAAIASSIGAYFNYRTTRERNRETDEERRSYTRIRRDSDSSTDPSCYQFGEDHDE